MTDVPVLHQLVDALLFWRPIDRIRCNAAFDVPVVVDHVPPPPADRSAGWYFDIHTPGYLRWWDGVEWERHWSPM